MQLVDVFSQFPIEDLKQHGCVVDMDGSIAPFPCAARLRREFM